MGKNATAGAVHLIPGKPSQDPEGYARLSLGNFNAVNAEAALGGALIDDALAGRVSALYQQRNGWLPPSFGGDAVPG